MYIRISLTLYLISDRPGTHTSKEIKMSRGWDAVRNAWTILYVAAVLRYQQVTMQ